MLLRTKFAIAVLLVGINLGYVDNLYSQEKESRPHKTEKAGVFAKENKDNVYYDENGKRHVLKHCYLNGKEVTADVLNSINPKEIKDLGYSMDEKQNIVEIRIYTKVKE
ncbi:hypothetical protein MASR1M31_05980 [Porphyromonadaceae bacterium]